MIWKTPVKMDMPKGAILHVGCIKRECGCNGPVYGDGTFRYVPIPEREEATEMSWTYTELELVDVLCQPWNHGIYAHYDPQFRDQRGDHEFTYGEPDTPKHSKRLQIARQLKKGEFLFFISSLEYKLTEVERQPDINSEWSYYVVGFFELAENPVIVPNPIPTHIRDQFSSNAHVLRNETDPVLLFKGERIGKKSSRQLARAKVISNKSIPNELAIRAMPWLRPRRNIAAEGWNYRWWGEDFVSEDGVGLLLERVRVDLSIDSSTTPEF